MGASHYAYRESGRRTCSSAGCKTIKTVKEIVIIRLLPHVIQFVIDASNSGSEAPLTLDWLGSTFNLVGWLESTQTHFVGKVVVDELVYSSEGGMAAVRCTPHQTYKLFLSGRAERLFYL